MNSKTVRMWLESEFFLTVENTRMVKVAECARRVRMESHGDEVGGLEAWVIAGRALKEELEPVEITPKPYDVLTHQIAGLLLKTRRLEFNDILELARNAYPYESLTLDDVEKILKYMHGRFPRLAWVSFEDKVVLKPSRTKALFEYYFDNLSMIPEEKQFLVVDESTDTSIGVLDEALMAEYGKAGTKFVIRGSPWAIIHTTEDKVYVRPVDDPTGSISSRH